MRHRSIAIGAIGLTLLSGAAMAQGGNGKPRFYVEGQVNTVPDTAVFDSNNTVSAYTSTNTVTGYTSNWSSNPGTFNSQTAEPGFVDHSHGSP
jgi:hypothetical protein